MTAIIIRRPKLGRTSAKSIALRAENPIHVVRHDWMHRRKHRAPLANMSLLIRWGCTAEIPTPAGVQTLNTSRAIHEVNDKRGFRMKLMVANPELVPQTWDNHSYQNQYEFPVIVRPRRHAQGKQLYVCRNTAEVSTITARLGEGNYYISKYIPKVAEYRVFVVQGRVASVARKTPGNPQDVAWNVARGGRFDNVNFDNWPLKAVRVALEGFSHSSLDFGGVDVMVDAEGNAYVIEINSAPSLPNNQDGTPTYRQMCMTKCFDYIIRNGKDRIPLVQQRGDWKKFVHPAISERALMV